MSQATNRRCSAVRRSRHVSNCSPSEAVQAQAGHRSIESTRIYLHLANDWLVSQYRHAVELIEAQSVPEAWP
jgi:site-specific recombinase XerC